MPANEDSTKNCSFRIKMIYIENASPLDDYKISVSFSTGEKGVADMSDIIEKDVF